MRFALGFALIAGLLLGLSGAADAQAMMVTADGHVYDDDTGNPVQDAHVTATHQGSYAVYDDWTDGSGHYSIVLETGDYRVEVVASGYESWQSDVTVWGDVTNDIHLDPTGGGDGGGDSNEDRDSEGFDPFAEMEQFIWVFYLVGALLITTFVCIVITSIATTATFVRLGKVKKQLKEIDEKLDEIEERDWRRGGAHPAEPQAPAFPPLPPQLGPQQGQQPPPQ
jgi:hypothetical protein